MSAGRLSRKLEKVATCVDIGAIPCSGAALGLSIQHPGTAKKNKKSKLDLWELSAPLVATFRDQKTGKVHRQIINLVIRSNYIDSLLDKIPQGFSFFLYEYYTYLVCYFPSFNDIKYLYSYFSSFVNINI